MSYRDLFKEEAVKAMMIMMENEEEDKENNPEMLQEEIHEDAAVFADQSKNKDSLKQSATEALKMLKDRMIKIYKGEGDITIFPPLEKIDEYMALEQVVIDLRDTYGDSPDTVEGFLKMISLALGKVESVVLRSIQSDSHSDASMQIEKIIDNLYAVALEDEPARNDEVEVDMQEDDSREPKNTKKHFANAIGSLRGEMVNVVNDATRGNADVNTLPPLEKIDEYLDLEEIVTEIRDSFENDNKPLDAFLPPLKHAIYEIAYPFVRNKIDEKLIPVAAELSYKILSSLMEVVKQGSSKDLEKPEFDIIKPDDDEDDYDYDKDALYSTKSRTYKNNVVRAYHEIVNTKKNNQQRKASQEGVSIEEDPEIVSLHEIINIRTDIAKKSPFGRYRPDVTVKNNAKHLARDGTFELISVDKKEEKKLDNNVRDSALPMNGVLYPYIRQIEPVEIGDKIFYPGGENA